MPLHRVFRRKSVSRPQISWPIESNREPLPPCPPIPPPLESYTNNSNCCSYQPRCSASTAPTLCSASTAPTSFGRRTPSISIDAASHIVTTGSCYDGDSSGSWDLDAYYAQFFDPADDIELSDDCPSRETLAQAGQIPIYDADGSSRPFSTLYEGELAIGEQQLIIFVRHFFCGACQSYLRTLTKSLTLEAYFRLPTPSSITIIGLGDPALIPTYRRRTGCPFPIYADPSRRIHRLLGMGWTLRSGKRVAYMEGISEVEWIKGQLKEIKETDRSLRYRGGNWIWVGGEFLVRDSEVVWCRRMKNYRGHVEVDSLKRLLGCED